MKIASFLSEVLLPPRRSLRQRIMLVLGSFSVCAVAGLAIFTYFYFHVLPLDPANSRVNFYFSAVALTLLVGTVLAHILVRRLTDNLERFTAHLQRLPELAPEERPFVAAGDDETKLVSTTFNLLLQEREVEHDALVRAAARAESATETKSDFLATISHELRTPLHGIIGLAQLCLESDLSGEQREHLRDILAAGKSLLHTVNDLLLLQKIESGHPALEKDEFSLRHLLDRTGKVFLPQVREKGLTLNLDIPDCIPDLLTGDPSRLRQILANLLDNACKFSERGTITLSVAVVAEKEEAVELRFSVRDEGRGIPSDRLERIFQPFGLGEEIRTRRFGGVGLGLAINRQILALMGSAMEVTSTPGAGSTFAFNLNFPRQTLAKDDNSVRLDDRCGRTALLLGGAPAAAAELADGLRRLQISALHADASRPLVDLPGRTIDLIVLDCSADESNCCDLIRLVRQHYGSHALLTVVAGADVLGGRGLSADGVDGFLQKPFSAEDFTQFVDYLLAHRQPGRERTGLPPITSYDVEESRYRLTALVVEDIEINRKIVTSLLRRHGHRVLEAVNGRQAVDLWRQHEIDLIFMDIQMPEMDGLEATRLIRSREAESGRRRLPVIAVTAGSLAEEKEACMAAGMDGYLLKPFDLGEFRSLLAQAVEAKLQGRQYGTQGEPV